MYFECTTPRSPLPDHPLVRPHLQAARIRASSLEQLWSANSLRSWFQTQPNFVQPEYGGDFNQTASTPNQPGLTAITCGTSHSAMLTVHFPCMRIAHTHKEA